jgi:hypothetical protein
MRRRAPDGAFIASTASLTVAALLFAAALWSALRIDPPPSIAPSPPGAMLALDGVLPGTQRDSASGATLASDPFNADRTLPGEADGDVAAAPDSAASAPAAEVRLLGTVVRGSNPFALCQLPTDAPRIVHVGEKLGDFTLVSLDQGRATFRARTGAQVELSLSKPGS